MEPTSPNLVPSNSLQNILNFRDVAQTINRIQGNDRLREGCIYRSARPVCTFLSTYFFFFYQTPSRKMCLSEAEGSCHSSHLT